LRRRKRKASSDQLACYNGGAARSAFVFVEERPERWGWDVDKHSHYSAKVQDALKKFSICWADYLAYSKINLLENFYRMGKVQDSFDLLVRARREETGVGAFLEPKSYKKAIQLIKNAKN